VGKLLDQIGPSVIFTHSGSGYPGWLTVIGSPKCWPSSVSSRALCSRKARFLRGRPVVSQADFLELTRIPIAIILGDRYLAASRAIAQSFVETVNNHGGKAKLIYLPDLGLFGNSHIMMMEKNNVQVADIVSQFLSDNGLDKHSSNRSNNIWRASASVGAPLPLGKD
jgi:hypothetical protein